MDYQPDAVLIEGPADADPLLRWVLADEMTPPLALLGYAADRPQTAAFWPYAVFSPEWQAMRYALQCGVEVAFCDLPAARCSPGGRANRPTTMMSLNLRPMSQPRLRPVSLQQHDPLAVLANAAGYDDPERWWTILLSRGWIRPHPSR